MAKLTRSPADGVIQASEEGLVETFVYYFFEQAASKTRNKWIVRSSNAFHYSSVLSNLKVEHNPKPTSVQDVIDALDQGLKRESFDRLRHITAISADKLSSVLNIPRRTLARRETFGLDESERIVRVTSAFQRTLEVFEDLEKGRKWFAAAQRAFGGRTPLEMCRTELGAREVENLLGRIEHGVYS